MNLLLANVLIFNTEIIHIVRHSESSSFRILNLTFVAESV